MKLPTRHLIAQGLRLAAAILLFGCTQEATPSSFQGYGEGEYLNLSSALGGKLERLLVRRGAQVAAGDTLAVLEHGLEEAAVAEAEQVLHQVENRLADLGKGQRPSELSAIAAQLERARTTLAQTQRELERRQKLYREKTIALETLDQAKTLQERAMAEVAEVEARLQTARLAARDDQIKAMSAEVEAARARLTQARWRLDQKTLVAGKAGTINDTFYEEGEFVPAGYPLLSLLPPDNIKVRFFVPEPLVGTLAIGQPVSVSFDGAGQALPAAITYIATQAEFTPPVIYSRETRAKLVFLVEAQPSRAAAPRLHPGQPVDVRLEALP